MNSSESSQPLRQITFIMLNRFWSLSKNPFTPIIPIVNGQYQTAWNANHKFWEGTSVKSYKIQLPVFLFLVLHYISRYHFHNFLEFHSTLSQKKFCPKFSFFTGFTPSPQPQPLNGQNLLYVTKAFCWFSLKCFLNPPPLPPPPPKFNDKILQNIF